MSESAPWQWVLSVACIFLAGCAILAVWVGRGQTKDVEGHVVAGRSLGALDLSFLIFGTMFSHFLFLGGPGVAYTRGAAVYYVLSYGVIGVAPLFFLGPRIGEIARRGRFVTQAQFVSGRFPGRALRTVMALVAAGVSIPYLALQMQGAGIVLETLTGGHVSVAMGAGVTYAVVVAYVAYGGAAAIARTSVLQGGLMLLGAWGLGLYLPHALQGGVAQMFANLAQTNPDLLLVPGLAPDGGPWSWGLYSAEVVYSAIAFAMWPHLFMRIFTAKTGRALRRAVLVFPLFQLTLVAAILVGLSAVGSGYPAERSDTVLLHLALGSGLTGLAVGLVCAAVMASSMSTGDSLVHSGATAIVEDLLAPSLPLSEATRRTLMQLATLLLAGLAFQWAVVLDLPVVWFVILAYSVVIQLAPPVYAALLWRRATPAGALWGLVAGLATCILLLQQPQFRPFGFDAGLSGLLVNVAVLVATSLLTEPQEEHHLSGFGL